MCNFSVVKLLKPTYTDIAHIDYVYMYVSTHPVLLIFAMIISNINFVELATRSNAGVRRACRVKNFLCYNFTIYINPQITSLLNFYGTKWEIYFIKQKKSFLIDLELAEF